MKSRIFRSISFRISFISTVFTIAILLTMGFVINQHVINHFSEQNKNQLIGKIQLIEGLFEQDQSSLKRNLDTALVGHENFIVQISLQDGSVLYRSKNTHINTKKLSMNPNSRWINWKDEHHSYQGIILDKKIGVTKQRIEIIAAIEITDNFQFLHFFKQQLVLIGIVGAICLMFLSWFATREGLSPLRKMAKISKNITAENLSDRLELKDTPVELIPLATALNEMFERLEVSVEKLSTFSSDLAHEMRTPINNLMMQTQVCLTKPRHLDDYREVLFSNLEEYERLAKMVSDMLFLAKADHRFQIRNQPVIHLEDEIAKLFDYFDALASDKNIILKQIGKAEIQANPDMIRRAFSNLISNAIKYGVPNSTLTIKFSNKLNETSIFIENHIPEEMQSLTQESLDRFFDRFYRLDSSRYRTEDGTGLGLAITKSIIELHNGNIFAYIEQDKIIFKILFLKLPIQN